MFRRLSHSLPPDPTFPDDMEQLGYFINDNDQIRMTANPKSDFQYIISKNDRVNDVHKEAMNSRSSSTFTASFANYCIQVQRYNNDISY